MVPNAKTSQELIQLATKAQLYLRLLQQLDKDFKLANIEIEISETTEPEPLKRILHEKIYFLLVERFDEYLNLLYIIDIPEAEVKKIAGCDAVQVAEEICFLILKREWIKVWFKNQYSNWKNFPILKKIVV